jgi:FkbM family methyltransferase
MRFFGRRGTPATHKSDGPEASATSRIEAELRQVRLELDFVRSRLSCYVGGGIALTYLVDETPIFVNANDFGGPFNLMNGGRYEEENVDVLFSFIKEDTVFLDIGANIGFFSLKISRRLGPNGRVYGFEPHPLLYDLLCRNVYVNGLRDVVTCFKLALSDKNTNATLQYPVGHLGGGHVGAGDVSGHTLVDAELKRLDDVLGADFRCDLVKIDVEGHEINVLDGMKNIVINSPQIKILFEKLMPNAGTEAALDAYFAELGYMACARMPRSSRWAREHSRNGADTSWLPGREQSTVACRAPNSRSKAASCWPRRLRCRRLGRCAASPISAKCCFMAPIGICVRGSGGSNFMAKSAVRYASASSSGLVTRSTTSWCKPGNSSMCS